MNATIIWCKTCGKELKRGEREWCENTKTYECAECSYHRANDTFTIEKYNEWLKKGNQ